MHNFKIYYNGKMAKHELNKLIGFASEKIIEFEINNNIINVTIENSEEEIQVKNKIDKLLNKYVNADEITNIELIGNPSRSYYGFNEILNSRLIHKFGNGQIALKGEAKKLFDYFDSSFAQIAKSYGAIEKVYPALLPISAYQETGYLKTSPQYSIFCSSPYEDIDLLEELNQKVTEDELNNLLSKPSFGLSPSACFHTYLEYNNEELENNTVITFNQNVFRNEGRFCWDDYGRLMDYHVREIVLIGSSEFVVETRNAIIRDIKNLIEDQGILAEFSTASDPFIVPVMQKYKKMQIQEKSKYELKLYCSDTKELACASFNLHGEAFTHPFNINVIGEKPTVSGCIGFGIERWVLSYLAQFGTNPVKWNLKI